MKRDDKHPLIIAHPRPPGDEHPGYCIGGWILYIYIVYSRIDRNVRWSRVGGRVGSRDQKQSSGSTILATKQKKEKQRKRVFLSRHNSEDLFPETDLNSSDSGCQWVVSGY